jgi:polysaccharide biosynthesis protein PslH
MQDLAADRVAVATINDLRFTVSKYIAWVTHAFRGTALDWVVSTGKSAELPDEITRLVSNLSVVLIHVNHVFTLGFAERLKQRFHWGSQVPMILETHDIQSHLMNERRDINPWTHKYDSLDELLRSEIALLRRPDVLVHCSVDDFNFFAQRLPEKKHVLALPTIDERFVNSVRGAIRRSLDPIDLLFVGQSTDVNLAAVRWFLDQVWPLLSDRHYNLKIVGAIESLVHSREPKLYQAFQSHFTGPVADLAPYYHSARCVIAPMVFGTGISIKTVEALGLAKPFIGTSKAFRGMPMDRLEQAGLHAHDSPQAFAEAISQALSNESAFASASRAVYDELFSKEAAFLSRDQALKTARPSIAGEI